MWRSLRAIHTAAAAYRAQLWELVTAGLAISAAYLAAGVAVSLGVGAGLAALKTYEADR